MTTPQETEADHVGVLLTARDPDGRWRLLLRTHGDQPLLPGGPQQPGEDPVATARRMLAAQAGLQATVEPPPRGGVGPRLRPLRRWTPKQPGPAVRIPLSVDDHPSWSSPAPWWWVGPPLRAHLVVATLADHPPAAPLPATGPAGEPLTWVTWREVPRTRLPETLRVLGQWLLRDAEQLVGADRHP